MGDSDEKDAESAILLTMDEQFFSFSKHLDMDNVENVSDGSSISLYQSDYWLRQAKVLEDRHVTMTDTGMAFYKFGKSKLTYDNWVDFLKELCQLKNLDADTVISDLTNCGLPGAVPVIVPKYRQFFATYKPKNVLIR